MSEELRQEECCHTDGQCEELLNARLGGKFYCIKNEALDLYDSVKDIPEIDNEDWAYKIAPEKAILLLYAIDSYEEADKLLREKKDVINMDDMTTPDVSMLLRINKELVDVYKEINRAGRLNDITYAMIFFVLGELLDDEFFDKWLADVPEGHSWVEKLWNHFTNEGQVVAHLIVNEYLENKYKASDIAIQEQFQSCTANGLFLPTLEQLYDMIVGELAPHDERLRSALVNIYVNTEGAFENGNPDFKSIMKIFIQQGVQLGGIAFTPQQLFILIQNRGELEIDDSALWVITLYNSDLLVYAEGVKELIGDGQLQGLLGPCHVRYIRYFSTFTDITRFILMPATFDNDIYVVYDKFTDAVWTINNSSMTFDEYVSKPEVVEALNSDLEDFSEGGMDKLFIRKFVKEVSEFRSSKDVELVKAEEVKSPVEQ